MSLSETIVVRLDRVRVAKIAKQTNITVRQLNFLVSDILQETFQLVKEDIIKWISKKVPKRTGQLRKTLLDTLEKSKTKKGLIQFIMGTHIEYARDVADYTTAQVRHHGTHFEHSGKKAYAYYGSHKKSKRKPRKAKRTARKTGSRYVSPHRIFLNDPDAIGNFWEELLKYLKIRVLIHLRDAMKKAEMKLGDLPWVIE